MNAKKLLQPISIGLMLLLLIGCGAPTSTPIPATPVLATPVPGIETPVDVGGTQVRVTEMNFGKYLGSRVTDNKDDLGLMGGYEAKAGFRYVEVIGEVTQGESAEKVKEWTVTLQDSQGKSYEVGARGWGVYYGNANNVGWTFLVPESETHLALIFPGGASVDLASLVSE